MKIVECPVINMHGLKIETGDDIIETQELVVATSTCSEEDYVRGLTFAWTVGLLYFNKLLQIPIILMHDHFGISHRELFDLFAEGVLGKLSNDISNTEQSAFPVTTEIRKIFMDKGWAITKGDYEFCYSSQWLGVFWQPEEFAMIKLYAENKLDEFYAESQNAFELLLRRNGVPYDQELLHQVFQLNRHMIKLPLVHSDITIDVDWNIWEYYRGIITGENVSLIKTPTTHTIDRSSEHWDSLDEWCQKVIFWQHKKGAYLYH